MLNKLKNMTKIEILFLLRNLIYILGGTIAIAFGTALFLTKLNIVSGGISGIAIIIQEHLPDNFLNGQAIDLVAGIIGWVLWLIGLIFLGKRFALKTLISTLIYPLALSLFLRVPLFDNLSSMIGYYGMSEAEIASIGSAIDVIPIGNLLICGIFAGVLVGTGVAFNFMGGGSSGGVDVLIAIINKYTGAKESIVSFLVDASIILAGAFLIPNNVIPSLCGVITAFVTAWMIEYFYIGSQTSYQADIISDHWEEISKYAQDVLGRGATVIHANGGYKGEDRVILRVVFDKTQFNESPRVMLRVVFDRTQLRAIREFIGMIDPKAFITFTQTAGVFGEGFKKHREESEDK